MKKPLGLKIYGALFLIYGVCISLYAVVRLTVPAAKSVIFPPSEFIVGGLIGMVALVNGIGVLRRKRWSYWLTLCCNAAWLLFSLVGGMPHPTSDGAAGEWNWGMIANALVWCGLIFWYFMRPSVKAQFQRKP